MSNSWKLLQQACRVFLDLPYPDQLDLREQAAYDGLIIRVQRMSKMDESSLWIADKVFFHEHIRPILVTTLTSPLTRRVEAPWFRALWDVQTAWERVLSEIPAPGPAPKLRPFQEAYKREIQSIWGIKVEGSAAINQGIRAGKIIDLDADLPEDEVRPRLHAWCEGGLGGQTTVSEIDYVDPMESE